MKTLNRTTLKQKFSEWVRRYAVAEVFGIITALAGAGLTRWLTRSLLASAIVANFAEGIGFYGYILVREARHYYRLHAGEAQLKRACLTAWHTVRGMSVEFAPAETLDTLFFRPALLYVMPKVLGNFYLGILSGKLLSDVVFYAIATVGYEVRKRFFAKS